MLNGLIGSYITRYSNIGLLELEFRGNRILRFPTVYINFRYRTNSTFYSLCVNISSQESFASSFNIPQSSGLIEFIALKIKKGWSPIL